MAKPKRIPHPNADPPEDGRGDDKVITPRKREGKSAPVVPPAKTRNKVGRKTHIQKDREAARKKRDPNMPTVGGPHPFTGAGKRAKGQKFGNYPTLTLTPEIFDEFVKIVAGGEYRTTAREILGISSNRYSQWLFDGKAAIAAFEAGERKTLTTQAQFVIALDQAEGLAHQGMFDNIKSNADPDLKFKILMKRWPKKWDTTQSTQVDDQTGVVEDKPDLAQALIDLLMQAKPT